MKKIAVLPLMFLLCSCGLVFKERPEQIAATELFENFMGLLAEKDADSIYGLFAPIIKEEVPSLREDVEELTHFYNGGAFVQEMTKRVRSDDVYHSDELWGRTLNLERTVICENRCYLICARWRDIDKDDPDKVGIHSLFIEENYSGDLEVFHYADKGIEINYGDPYWWDEI